MSRTFFNTSRYEPTSDFDALRDPISETHLKESKHGYSYESEELAPLHTNAPQIIQDRHDCKPPSLLSKLLQDWWFTEIIAWLVAIGSMIVIIYFLKKYDQQPLSQWPFPITVNAFLQIFTTVLRSAMLVPVAQSISQLKWTWFSGRNRSINHFTTFNDASRGVWGSIRLIWLQKAIRLASLGALITILSFATSTTVQQSVSYPVRRVISLDYEATVPYNAFYSGTEGVFDGTGAQSYPLSTMKAAIYNGFLGDWSTNVDPVTPVCSTGNCTWPSYSSLAVCASIANITTSIIEDDQGRIALPGGHNISGEYYTSLQIFDNLNAVWGGGALVYNMSSIAFTQVVNPIADFMVLYGEPGTTGDRGFQGFECLLELCVQTYETWVENGLATTVITKNQTAESLNIALASFTGGLTSGLNFESPPIDNMTLQVPDQKGVTNYSTPISTVLALQIFLGKVLPGFNDVSQYLETSDSVANFLTATEGHAVPALLKNIATSMTNEIRKGHGTSTVTGTGYTSLAYINVEWKWFAFPMAMIVLTFILLVLTIVDSYRSSVEIWKDSTLAMMLIMKESTRKEIGPMTTNSVMAKAAEPKQVRLRKKAGNWYI